MDHILQCGKDSLDPSLLVLLRRVRDGRWDDPRLTAMLDCVLDKYEDRYDYRSYLALDVLKPLLPSPSGSVHGRQLVRLLLADLVRFESATANDVHDPRLPLGRPDPDMVKRRIRKALRMGTGTDDARLLPVAPDDQVETALKSSMQPVSARHDEYLFIRVLQSYETTFLIMVEALKQALHSAHLHDILGVVDHIDDAAAELDRVSGLFSLLATMRPKSFRAFRDQTDGSSAIQSRAFKSVEILCGLPTRQRLDSAAFRSVPDVREQALSQLPQPDSLAAWYLSEQPHLDEKQRERIDAALARLSQVHHKWKRTHLTLARNMIGDAVGTGDTDGVKYLQRNLNETIFWEVGL